MTPQQAGARLKHALVSADDGTLMRHAFQLLLAACVVFIVIDWRELSESSAALPAVDPAQPSIETVLPPALTEGEPQDAPSEITTDAAILKKAMRFELKPGGILLAEGTIDPGASARFAAEIEARGEYVKMVAINSPGGSVADALAMSKLIRARGIDTHVNAGALCASSCPLLIAGGVNRTVDKGAVVGVHQIFNGSKQKLSPELAMSEAQKTTAEITRHLDAMGIKPGLWQNALETPPDRLYYLTLEEMAALALTTPAAVPVAQVKKR